MFPKRPKVFTSTLVILFVASLANCKNAEPMEKNNRKATKSTSGGKDTDAPVSQAETNKDADQEKKSTTEETTDENSNADDADGMNNNGNNNQITIAYVDNVKPVFVMSCEPCHSPGGSYPALPLTTFNEVRNAFTQALARVQDPQNPMPPSNTTPEQRADIVRLLQGWEAQGFAETLNSP